MAGSKDIAIAVLKKPHIPKQNAMTENKIQPATVEKESQQASTHFHNNTAKTKAKELQKEAKETKPVFQTYIYRSYGGGYQGL